MKPANQWKPPIGKGLSFVGVPRSVPDGVASLLSAPGHGGITAAAQALHQVLLHCLSMPARAAVPFFPLTSRPQCLPHLPGSRPLACSMHRHRHAWRRSDTYLLLGLDSIYVYICVLLLFGCG